MTGDESDAERVTGINGLVGRLFYNPLEREKGEILEKVRKGLYLVQVERNPADGRHVPKASPA